MRLVAVGLAFVFLLHCGAKVEPLTELVVAIDTDLAIPKDATTLTVNARDERETVVDFEPKALTAEGLPVTIGLTSANDDARRIVIEASLTNGTTPVVKRTVAVQFVPHETRFVALTLCGLCRGAKCADTCGESGCEATDRPGPLPAFDGTVPPRPECTGCAPGAVRAPLEAFDASNPDFPHVCNIDNVLVKDDKVAGLDYSEGSNVQAELGKSFTSVGGVDVPGCIGVDFGAPAKTGPIVVRARALRDNTTACGAPCLSARATDNCLRCCPPCSTDPRFIDPNDGKTLCEKGGKLLIFAGVEKGTYEPIGNQLLGNDLEEVRIELTKPARFVVACRAPDGPAAADVAVDAIWSEVVCP